MANSSSPTSTSEGSSREEPRCIVLGTSRLPHDMEVHLGKNTVCLLHSHVLRHFSPVFDAALSERWWADDSAEKVNVKYSYYLVQPEGENGEWMLVPSRDVKEVKSCLPPCESGIEPPTAVVKKYEIFLMAFYHHHNEPITLRWTLDFCVSLAVLASFYDAAPVVKDLIESYIHFNQALSLNNVYPGPLKCFPASAQCYVMMYLSILIHSRSLYKTAFDELVERGTTALKGEDAEKYIPDVVRLRLYEAVSGTKRYALTLALSSDFPWEADFARYNHQGGIRHECLCIVEMKRKRKKGA